MTNPDAKPMPRRPTPRTLAAFLGILVLLYAGAFALAERIVAREGQDGAFQKLLAARGEARDWLVLGASHALPLEYGDVPGRLRADTGRTMTILAEIGAGPLYNRFVLEQALRDLRAARVLYVLDDFGFHAREWNEERIADRGLLRRTPLRVSTAAIMAGFAMRGQADIRGLADYLTGFSKLNPPDRFPQEGWRGAETFGRVFRPSRHAVQARMEYLYPEPPDPATSSRYLDGFAALVARAQEAGAAVTVVRLPVPEGYRAALPEYPAFEAELMRLLEELDVAYHDLSAAMDDPRYYFDTDHLNADGVETLYDDHLLRLLAPE